MAVTRTPADRSSRPLPAVPARVQASFGERLLAEELITPTALQNAAQHAAQSNMPLHAAVVALGFVEERLAYRLLADVAGMDFVDARTTEPSQLAMRLVTAKIARRHDVLPLTMTERTVTYVTARPYDMEADRDVSFTTGRTAIAKLAAPSDLRTALDKAFPNVSSIESLMSKARATTVVEHIDTAALDIPSDSAIIELCNTILARAVESGCSDLHLDPSDQGILARIRVGGVLENLLTVPVDIALPVRNRFKIMARADISVKHRPQDGAFAVRISGRRIDVRLSTLPTTSSEKIVMRIIDSQSDLQALDTLGYDEALMVRLRRVLDRPDGLVLVTGPTGSGKTTALYAALHYLRSARVNIISVEDPVERTLRGINQIPVNNLAGATFATVLRSVLRQDPDVLMVGEVRDTEVAGIVGQAAFTGRLVLSSLHTIDAATAVTRLRNLGLEPYRIAESLSGILAQRLVRRLCPSCSVPAPAGRTAGPGCRNCNSTGFAGRIPVVELLTPGDEMRDAIARGATPVEVRQVMRNLGVPTMREHARALVAAGMTSADEIARVLGTEDAPGEVAAPKASTVLVADDEPITRTLVKLLLDKDGYGVIEATTGREAVDLARSRRPGVIVMDLNMPNMDGYDAIAEIRRDPAMAQVPIVVVSATEGPDVERHVLALGADDYIIKPFDTQVLTARIKAAFRRQRLAEEDRRVA